jgi:hypothetical protein
MELAEKIMAGNSWIRCMGFLVVALLVAPAANGQAGNVALPAGSMTWQYQCKAGSQCPTKCTVQGAELFSTSNYVALTIVELPNKRFWFQVDTGLGPVDYLTQADTVTCSIAGAMLTSARTQEGDKPLSAPR